MKAYGNIDAKPGEYRVNEFLVTMDDSEIRADVGYTMSVGMDPGRPKLAEQMSVKNIDLTPFLDSGDDTGLTGDEVEATENAIEEILEKTVEKEPASDKKLFSSEPLSVGVLQDYDIDLKVDVANIAIREDFSIDGSASVTLNEGLLKLGPFDIKGNTGGVGTGKIVLDARDTEASLDIFLDFDDFAPPRIGGTLAEPRIGIDPKDVAKKYASYSAYVATGGLSFLAEKLFDTVKANRDQCKRIIAALEEK